MVAAATSSNTQRVSHLVLSHRLSGSLGEYCMAQVRAGTSVQTFEPLIMTNQESSFAVPRGA